MPTRGVEETKVCVLGLGYIGLPTAAIMAARGYGVFGVDVRPEVVEKLRGGGVHIEEPGLATLVGVVMKSGALQVGEAPVPADVFVIAVPTPFKNDAAAGGEGAIPKADLSYVESAARALVPCLRPGSIVILESTSPPGTTRTVVAPILAESGLRIGEEVFLAHSPERVLPGAILKEMIANHRVVGGINPASARKAAEVYAQFVEGEIFETDCTTAEMVKLSENTFRDVNIALANELAKICECVGSDVWEVVRLANRHPRVNIHQPGPGVGGHCIAVDPWFLVERCPKEAQLLHLARRVNDRQPGYVVERLERILAERGLVPGAQTPVAFLGLTYKANVDDVRESPSLEIVRAFTAKHPGAVLAHDPYVAKYPFPLAASLDEVFARANVLVFLVSHREYLEIPPERFADTVVLDTKNCFGGGRDLPPTCIYTLLGRETPARK